MINDTFYRFQFYLDKVEHDLQMLTDQQYQLKTKIRQCDKIIDRKNRQKNVLKTTKQNRLLTSNLFNTEDINHHICLKKGLQQKIQEISSDIEKIQDNQSRFQNLEWNLKIQIQNLHLELDRIHAHKENVERSIAKASQNRIEKQEEDIRSFYWYGDALK
jgi:chromosome segregation ATPase